MGDSVELVEVSPDTEDLLDLQDYLAQLYEQYTRPW